MTALSGAAGTAGNGYRTRPDPVPPQLREQIARHTCPGCGAPYSPDRVLTLPAMRAVLADAVRVRTVRDAIRRWQEQLATLHRALDGDR